MPKLPLIGDRVVFYKQADVDGDPIAAIVLDNAGGILHLATIPKFSAIQHRANVRHVDDPLLKERDVIRHQYGGWDTIDAAERRLREKEERAAEAVRAREQRRREKEERERRETDQSAEAAEIVRLKQEQSLNATEIAEQMTVLTGRTWNHQKVNAILRKAGQLVAS